METIDAGCKTNFIEIIAISHTVNRAAALIIGLGTTGS